VKEQKEELEKRISSIALIPIDGVNQDREGNTRRDYSGVHHSKGHALA